MKFLTLVLSTLFAVSSAQAFKMGEQTAVRAPFCETKDEAIAIAKADSEQGIQEAIKLFTASRCGSGEATVIPKKIIVALPTERGATVRVVEVSVDMGNGKTVTAYILTDVDVEVTPVI